jgi:biopolymer transport protein ExbD
MQAAVQASGSQRDPVIINADALATHQTVVNVMEAARLAGYPKLTLRRSPAASDLSTGLCRWRQGLRRGARFS